MRTGQQQTRRGFTLVETVVTVGIIAALAAVVYPTVVRQFDTADPTRAAEDLNNVRTGIEAFGINVRPNQPKDIEDLANVITIAAPDSSARGALYSTTDVNNWHGPYIALSVPVTMASNDTAVVTGFGAAVVNRLGLFDINVVNGGDTVSTPNAVNAEFVAIRLKGLSGAAFNAINELIDGPLESTAILRRHAGRFRCPGAAAPLDTDLCTDAYYLASPVR
jgi:prepilin-type N-terminal cleavage/methylation domain-containing protein